MTPSRGFLPLATFLAAEAALAGAAAGVLALPWFGALAAFLIFCAGLLAGWALPAVLGGFATALAAGLWTLPATSVGVITPWFGLAALISGAGLAFLNILLFGEARAQTTVPPRQLLARWLVPAHFAVAGLLFAAAYFGGDWARWLGIAAAAATIILALDVASRLVARLFTPRRHWPELPEPSAFFFYRWLGEPWSGALRPPSGDSDAFRLQFAEMWMWPTVRRSLPLLLLAGLALAWLATTLHEVPAGSEGVRHRLGRWDAQSLKPGLHVSLPWPLGGVRSVETARLREIVLGFQSDPGQAILWERAHYVNEQMSLVGSGDDFLSISVPVFFRVANAADYLRASEDPEGLLRSLAERLLLQFTAALPAGEIMTTAREPLREALRDALQQELDARRAGLEVAAIYLRDIHPPVAVAPAFQEVVGAMEEREAFIYEGEAYRRDQITRAHGTARAIRVDAGSAARRRLLAAGGETARFRALAVAWQESPALFQWRERFRAVDETLSGAKKVILDERLRQSAPAQVDLRRVMNPDFVDSSASRPQSLVPSAARSREAFDLDIEGFLRMDRGEIPAVRVGPEDGDNLLRPSPSPTPTP